MRRLNIQVLGIDPANKGACLMLAALQQELRHAFKDPRIAVNAGMPFDQRLRLGLWAVTPPEWESGFGVGRLKGTAVRMAREQSHKLGLLSGDEIDVILDASGFAYGDFWGKAKFQQRLGDCMAGWKARGKTVIALPQAWGGFNEAGFAKAVQEGLASADLVFARDGESLSHLQQTGLAQVERAPDFTNLLAPALPPGFEDLRGAGFVIPNTKMLEAHGDSARAQYIEFLRQGVMALQTVCADVHILVHEGAKDLALSQELNSHLDAPLRIIDPPDALDTKAILGAARALISSRFHGLVSALSAGVPCLACGWSHKYKELMADYGAAQYVANLDQPDSWSALMAAFAQDIQDPTAQTRLKEAANAQKVLSRAAWTKIITAIEAGTGISRRSDL